MKHKDKRREFPYLPTLIDRLLDDAPGRQTEPFNESLFDAQAMRTAIKRDLTLLLNTINLNGEIDINTHPAISNSVLNYGIPAFGGGHIADRNWINVGVMIRKAVLDFEPRLIRESVSVSPLKNVSDSNHYNVLTFALSGLIKWSPYPLEFQIQTAFDLETSRINLLES
ncbi:type VI secretion system baseplate subunit TssE [Glaciimonas immobilis]|nr:type VI secretion system baseplate subunit TssE [Glaciimonas immobilis]